MELSDYPVPLSPVQGMGESNDVAKMNGSKADDTKKAESAHSKGTKKSSPTKATISSPPKQSGTKRKSLGKVSSLESLLSTPSVDSEGLEKESATKKKRPASVGLAKKKQKVEGLEKELQERKNSIERLRRLKSKLEAKMNEDLEAVKFPVKDEELPLYLRKGQAPPSSIPNPAVLVMVPPQSSKVISSAAGSSAEYLTALIPDILYSWNFLSSFRKQLNLSALSLTDFTDLICYSETPSVALAEVFVSLLKTLFQDPAVFARLCMTGQSEGRVRGKLLPKKLKLSVLNSITYQSVLSEVWLKLPAVRQLRKSLESVYPGITSELSGGVKVYGDVTGETPYFARSVAVLGMYTVKREKAANSVTNKDILEEITSHPIGQYESVLKLDEELASTDIHALSPFSKLVLLRYLCESCLDTERFQNFLTANGETRSQKLSELNSLQASAAQSTKEARFRLKEFSDDDRARAFVNCRVSNIESIANARAIAKHTTAGGKATKEVAVKKVLDDGTEVEEAIVAPSYRPTRKELVELRSVLLAEEAKTGKSDKLLKVGAALGIPKEKTDKFSPNTTQLVAEMDEIAVLRKLGVDVVIGRSFSYFVGDETKSSGKLAKSSSSSSIKSANSVTSSPTRQTAKFARQYTCCDWANFDEFGIPLDDDDCESDDVLEQIPIELLDAKQKVQLRQKAKDSVDRSKRRLELEQIALARSDAEYYLKQALLSNKESDLRSAIKYGKRAGLHGEVIDPKTDNVLVYCTELMKKAYRARNDIEEAAKEEKLRFEHEAALYEYFVRVEPIGTDRYQRRYYAFGEDDRLFVEVDVRPTHAETQAVEKCSSDEPKDKDSFGMLCSGQQTPCKLTSDSSPTSPKGLVESLSANNLPAEAKPLDLQGVVELSTQKLVNSKPTGVETRWYVYNTVSDIWKLYESLDERGEREKALKSAIKSSFDLTEPPLEFLSSGHHWIGRKIKRVFGGKFKRTVVGVITGWLPKEGSDPALWHAKHIDGDEEDLEEHEVLSFLIDTKAESEDIPPEQQALLATIISNMANTVKPSASPSRLKSNILSGVRVDANAANTALAKDVDKLINAKGTASGYVALGSVSLISWISSCSTSNGSFAQNTLCANAESSMEVDNDDDDEEFDGGAVKVAPQFVNSYHNSMKSNSTSLLAFSNSFKKNSVGLEGLRGEFVRCISLVADGIKKKAGAGSSQLVSREQRKIWESAIRNASSPAPFISLLIELEHSLHSLQTRDDVAKQRSSSPVLKSWEQHIPAMRKEGWVFNSNELKSKSLDNISDALLQSHVVLLQKRVRRHFKGHGISNGTVVGYLPTTRADNDDVELFHIVHDDGDEEDLEYEQILKGSTAFEEDWQEEDERFHSDNDDDEEDGSSSDNSSDNEDEDDEDEDENDKLVGGTLWPFAEDRSEWITSTQACANASEILLSLMCLLEHAWAFDAMPSPSPTSVTNGLESTALFYVVTPIGRRGDEKSGSSSHNPCNWVSYRHMTASRPVEANMKFVAFNNKKPANDARRRSISSKSSGRSNLSRSAKSSKSYRDDDYEDSDRYTRSSRSSGSKRISYAGMD